MYKKTHIFKLCMLLVGMLALRPDDVQASHFRYGNITWERVAGQPTQVKFRITQAWRRSAFGTPNVGAVIGGGTFNPGSGSAISIPLVVTSINTTEDWIYGEYTYVKDYQTTTGNYTASFAGCCRVSNVQNNPDGNFDVNTIVTLGNNNDAPVSSVPPFINLPVGSTAATYQIPATDPNGDNLTFSLVPNGGFGVGTTQPNGISISSSGLLTFNTVGKTVGSLWNTAIYITDSKGARIQLDLMIRIATQSTPPVFDYAVTPANNMTYVLTPGQTVSFNVKASDVDAGDNVNMSAVGLPVGSSFTAGSGNPVTRSFSWTPTVANIGTFQVNFIAQDNASIQTNTIVNIAVSTKPNFVAPSILNGSILCYQPGDVIQQQYYATDVDTADRIILSLATPLQSGMSFSPSLPTAQANPASSNFTWVTTAANWGINKVIIRATDKYSEMRDDTVTYIVSTPPVFATTQNDATVIAGQPFSYTFSGTDADTVWGDSVILSHTHIPSWMTITDNLNGTWTLSGTPSIADAGANHVTLQLQDLTNHYNGSHCGQATQSFEINVLPCNITTSTAITNVSCYGTSTGAVNLTVNNATAPITYTWNNSATTQDLNGVAAGSYSVVVTDANGCTASAAATITQPTAALNYNVTTANPNCATPNSGSATVAGVTGGVSPYEYSVGSGTYSSSNVLAGLAPGIYQVNVKDAGGCVLSKGVSIIKPFCSVAVNDTILNCGGNVINIPLSQLLGNDTLATGETIAVGDWSTNATGGGTVTYNSTTKIFTYIPPVPGFNGQVSFTYTIKKDDNTVAFSGNGHFYEFKPGAITWTNAKNAASALSYNGMQGYLATVTSAAENAFINSKLQANGWMGASDLASEGTWRWVTGPEGLENGGLGRHFTNQNKGGGNCAAGTGSAANGNYINWQGGEPNDCGAFYSPGNTNPSRLGEHVAHFYTGSGTWNDFPDNAGVDGYVVEYGGLEVIAPVTLTSTATVLINNAAVVASSAKTAPLCPGASNGTITVTATGGAMPYQYSKDNGTNYQSSNSFTDLTAGSYTMKVKDANGCTVAHIANIPAGVDNTAPTVSCPSDITVNAAQGQCNASVSFTATATDNCTASPVITYSQNPGTTFPVGTTTVTVTAKDAYNNTSAPCTFTVTVLDVEAPVITCPANIAVANDAGICGAVVNYSLPMVSDNCSGPVDPIVNGSFENNYAGWNVSSTSASCGVFGILTSGQTVTYGQQLFDYANNVNETVISPGLPYTANPTDGNKMATLLVRCAANHRMYQDVTLPVGDINLSFDVQYKNHWTNFNTGQYFAVVLKNPTTNAVLATLFKTMPGDPLTIPMTTKTVSLSAFAGQTVRLEMVEANINSNYMDVYMDNVKISGTQMQQTAGLKSGSIFPVGTTTNTFVATDLAGNSSTCSFDVTVNDVQKPTISVSNVAVNTNNGCEATNVALGTPLTNDNCGVALVSNNAPSSYPVGISTVLWTVTDIHGNTNTATQTVTVTDNEKPVVVTKNVTVQLDANGQVSIAAADVNNGSSDNCGIATVSVAPSSFNCANVGGNNVVLTVTDVHGNVNTGTVTVTVQDNTQPTISCPSDVTVSCDASTATAATGSATANDNCGIASITHSDVSTQDANTNSAGHYNYTIARTWTATDVNGNSKNCTQTITVEDVAAPSISVPANATVNCQDATTTEALGLATGDDNCSPVAISYTDASTQNADVNNAGHYNYTITRTWKSMDVTGNYVTDNQTIAVQDVTNPSITVPANATVNCQDATTPAALGSATGDDNCSPVAISHTDVSTQNADVNNAGHYNYTITRTWKSMDVTGNYVTGNQTITVQDVTNPSITVPVNATASCKTSVADNGTATGTDNCGPVAISYTDASNKSANVADASYYDYTITRTWKATDVTGNFTTDNQVITVSELRGAAIAVTPVNTINSNHPNYTIYLGYGPQSVTLAATVSGGVGNRTYSWSPSTGVANPNAATTSVAPTTTTTYTVTITDATGCTIQKSITINVIDVRCGNKVQICHFPPGNPGNAQQQCLPASAIAAHLAHGCRLGVCPQAKGQSEEEEHNISDVVVEEIKVYPNPSTGVFTVALPESMDRAEMVIMDMAGKLIEKRVVMGEHTIRFNLENVARGTYMIRVATGSNTYHSKITLQ